MANVTLLPESQQLDRYQLIGEIASGGMASVFLGRLAGIGGFQRLVAIKRLHPHLAKEQEFVEMFLDEARLAASIHHRNVVPILEIGTTIAGYYLVMEYIEGVTLARLMTQSAALRDPVPRPVLLRLMVDTLCGLHAAHELNDDANRPLGVVHRDCSPQNILVGLDGCTRITDFGIARASSRLHNTREGAMKGKLAYMAPEQTQGDEFDRRADLWSVAVVLWEVLAQRRLFKSKTEAQTLKRLLHDPIPRLTDIEKTISPALASVCQMALERNPDDRFQTAAEMADAIESAAKVAARDEEPVATERTVEALMKKRYGGDVDAQREEVRTFLHATPTMIGPRQGSTTDPGWMGPTASEPGVILTRSNTWEKASLEEPTAAVSPPEEATQATLPPEKRGGPTTSRSWPAPVLDAAEGSPEAGVEPLLGPAAADIDDETHIYDPTSTAGVTADPENTDWVNQPDPQASAALLLATPRPSRVWPMVLGLLFVGGGATVVAYQAGWLGGGTVATRGDGDTHARPRDESEPATKPVAVPASAIDASAEAPEVEPPVAPNPRAPTPRPVAFPRPSAPATQPAPTPAPAPDADPAPKPDPGPAPKPKPKDLDDLSNPYR